VLSCSERPGVVHTEKGGAGLYTQTERGGEGVGPCNKVYGWTSYTYLAHTPTHPHTCLTHTPHTYAPRTRPMHMPHAHAPCTRPLHMPHADVPCTCLTHMSHAHAPLTCTCPLRTCPMHTPCTCPMHTHTLHTPHAQKCKRTSKVEVGQCLESQGDTDNIPLWV
jgi:hypothetical protein